MYLYRKYFKAKVYAIWVHGTLSVEGHPLRAKSRQVTERVFKLNTGMLLTAWGASRAVICRPLGYMRPK